MLRIVERNTLKTVLVAIAGFAIAGAFTDFARAQPNGGQAPAPNIVTLSFTAVVMQTAEAQREFAALEKKFAPRKAHVQSLNDEVKGLRRQLLSAGEKLSDQERAAREQTLQSREKELQRSAEDLRSDSQTESQEAFQRVAQKVYTFLQTYAQQQAYSLVVERGSEASPVVWYASAEKDITQRVAQAYDAQSGAPGTAPAPKP